MIYVLVHYTDSFKPLINISRPILEEYCNAHDYVLSIRQVDQYAKYTGIEKLQHIDDVLRMGDVALVLDADVLLTNLYIKVESFIDSEHDLYLAGGCNAGVFICRKTPKFKSFLVDCIKQIYLGNYDCEQPYFEEKAKEGDEMIKVLPHPSINSYLCNLYPEHGNTTSEQGCWEVGHFVCHIPAQSMDKRIAEFNKLKEQIVR